MMLLCRHVDICTINPILFIIEEGSPLCEVNKGKVLTVSALPIDCRHRRWYKYGRRQKRIFLGYTAFAGLGLLFLAMIVGFIVYGLHSGDSDANSSASARGFKVFHWARVMSEDCVCVMGDGSPMAGLIGFWHERSMRPGCTWEPQT